MKHLTLKERYQIVAFSESGLSKSEISRRIRKHKTTICRELTRNKSPSGYDPEIAERKAVKRKKSAHKKKKFDWKMIKMIEEKLKENWSPEQISGYCKKHGIDMVSHERIYQYVWQDKNNGGELYKRLRHANKRRKRYGSKETRGQIKDRVSIDERPEIVDQKIRFGDWEGDTIVGSNHKGYALTLVERKTKMTIIAKLNNKSAETTENEVVKQLYPIRNLCHTITFDNGKEFARHKEIARKLGVKIYFAHTYSSYERGLNENTNGLIRQYLPKKTDLGSITKSTFKEIEKRLNQRPRKALEFTSPADAFLQMRL